MKMYLKNLGFTLSDVIILFLQKCPQKYLGGPMVLFVQKRKIDACLPFPSKNIIYLQEFLLWKIEVNLYPVFFLTTYFCLLFSSQMENLQKEAEILILKKTGYFYNYCWQNIGKNVLI